ncbi:MAG: hypothetical protein NHB15_13500 [Methanosarcina barkeri]|nr:hypothetical protein [Methanosarcina sp. ERenArc_MAG2]
MIKRGIKSTIVVLLLLGIFTGLAAAITDVYMENSGDVTDTRSSAVTINCPTGTSNVYHANINSGSDVDWFKASIPYSSSITMFIDSDAYQNYVSGQGENSGGSLITRTSLRYGPDGTHFVTSSPVYFKLKNDYSRVHSDYQFFVQRS